MIVTRRAADILQMISGTKVPDVSLVSCPPRTSVNSMEQETDTFSGTSSQACLRTL